MNSLHFLKKSLKKDIFETIILKAPFGAFRLGAKKREGLGLQEYSVKKEAFLIGKPLYINNKFVI